MSIWNFGTIFTESIDRSINHTLILINVFGVTFKQIETNQYFTSLVEACR